MGAQELIDAIKQWLESRAAVDVYEELLDVECAHAVDGAGLVVKLDDGSRFVLSAVQTGEAR